MSDPVSPSTAATTLVSLSTLRAWMGVESSDTAKDAVLVQCADAASAELESQTGLIFVTRAVLDTKDGAGRPDLWLSRLPVVAVSSVTVDGAALGSSAYVLDAARGRLRLAAAGWPSGIANIAVAYTAGYGAQGAATLPADVVRACLDLSKAIYDEKTAGAITLSSISLGPGSMVLKSGKFPPSVQRVLDRWREVRV